MTTKDQIIERVFKFQGANGCWKMLPKESKHYPECLHYSPIYKATLWVLILLADVECDTSDHRVVRALKIVKDHFFDSRYDVYSLKDDHFPIPCLNGNILYIESYFENNISNRSLSAIDFFCEYQRFDDGAYIGEKNKFCENKSCYGKHTCYWGVVKLLKGLSFIPKKSRNASAEKLIKKCTDYILLHRICFSSRKKNKIMIKNIDRLTFPNMYRSDFLEILWLMKREKVKSPEIIPALELLRSKRLSDGNWKLERKNANLITSIGEIDQSNYFVTQRAKEVLSFYKDF